VSRYRFEAMSASGEETAGEIVAADEQVAKLEISRRGYFLTKLTSVEGTAHESGDYALARESLPQDTSRQPAQPDLRARHAHDKRVMGWGFVGMGGLVLMFVGWMALDDISFVLSAQRTTGTCIGQAYNSSDSVYNIPIVEFTVDGRACRVESKGTRGMVFVSGYVEGQRVSVMYPPGSPDEARVGGAIGILQIPAAFCGAGVLFISAGVWLARSARRMDK